MPVSPEVPEDSTQWVVRVPDGQQIPGAIYDSDADEWTVPSGEFPAYLFEEIDNDPTQRKLRRAQDADGNDITLQVFNLSQTPIVGPALVGSSYYIGGVLVASWIDC